MLPKRVIAFLVLAMAAVFAACSNLGLTTGQNVGPNFPSKTLYATNSNENAVSIFSNGLKSGSGPSYNIGGANTQLNGPQYIAFDRRQNLWVTNYNPSTQAAILVQFQALATGNVDPLSTVNLPGHPRGIAFTPKGPSPAPSSSVSPPPPIMVIADVISTDVYPDRILLYSAGANSPYQSIAGPRPNLKLPGGVAIDKSGHVYVANIAGATVSQFVLPTPSPTPKPTPTVSPTPTPTPSPTPSTSPSPSPTPSPTPTPINIYPRFSITAKNDVITPMSVALDASGNIYILDQGHPKASCSASNAPAILVFPPYNKKIPYTKPIRKVQGCKTLLLTPTDIKINKDGLIFVADETRAGKGIIYVYEAGAAGNQAPMSNYTSPGAVTGLGIIP